MNTFYGSISRFCYSLTNNWVNLHFCNCESTSAISSIKMFQYFLCKLDIQHGIQYSFENVEFINRFNGTNGVGMLHNN